VYHQTSYLRKRILDGPIIINNTESQLIGEVIHSQTAINKANLRKRYASYTRTPKLMQRVEMKLYDFFGTTDPTSISYMFKTKR